MLLYTLLNIVKSPGKAFQLMLSAALVFLLLFAAMAFENGMHESLDLSGDPKNVMLLGTGSEESVERSEIPPESLSAAQALRGLDQAFGRPSVSPEVIYNASIEVEGREAEAILRGVTRTAIQVYPQFALSEGRFPGSGEVCVGKLAHQKLGMEESDLRVGQTIVFEGQEFMVSGHFTAPGSVMESEIWMSLGDIMALTQRDRYSSITLRLDKAQFDDVDLMVKRRQDLQISAIREQDYYAKLSDFYAPIRWMAWLTAWLIASGAIFGAMNSCFASLEGRKREFATLQAIGFTPWRLFGAMLVESCLLHLGAFLLAALLATFTFPKLALGFGSIYFSLNIEVDQLLQGLNFALMLSLLVVILPAYHILVPPLQTHLKQ
jgi:ABC-type lipoprotein release transport system permease subunit